MEGLSLIDVSGEDDFLLDLASPPQHPDPPPRAATGSSMVGADLVQPAAGSQAAAPRKVLDPSGATEQVPERTESPKKSKPKGGVNLRKSLAWDSAFFTGEGVLDTEELGIVNSTFRKSQGSRLLPGIAEEMRRSSESTTSTIESESFVLESLETELFDNVRASIQRTLGKPGKAPHVTAASSKNSKAPAKAPPVTVRKGVDRISQTQSKIRPPVSTSSGYGAGSKQRPQVTPKEPTAAKVAVSRAAEVKPSSRPPRALPRVATMRTPSNTASTSAISDKRSSTGGVVNRQTVGNSANGSASMSSRPGVGSKTSSTSKSGALSSSVISSLHSEPLGTVHGSKTKSPTLTAKGRAQRIPIRLSSRSDINKVDPARASLRSKIPTRSHGEGASPIISPSSSVDSMSSVVSGVSTASTIGKASHTSETFSTRSSSVSPSTRKSNDHPPTANPRPLTVAEGTSCDSLISSIDTSTHGNGFKPSGLRRPTPKIGYFDPEKSVEQKAARAQLQPMKVLFSPLATPNPPISSTPKKYPSFPTFDQHELMSMAVPPSQTKASPSLPIKVSQPEVELSKVSMAVPPSQTKASPSLPIKVSQPEVEISQVSMAVPPSQTKASPSLPIKVSQPEVETSKVTLHEVALPSQTKASPSLPARVSQPEVETSKVTLHEVALPSQTEASPLLPARVAQTEVESSKVTLHEVALPSQTEASPLLPVRVAQTEVEPCKVHEASPTKAQPSLPLGVAQTEVDPSKAMEHGASQNEASPLLPLRVAQTEAEPSKVMEHEASQTKASSTPLRVAQTEVESSKVLEHEAHMCETDLLVAMDIAEDSIPLPLELSSCTSGQQESGTTAASQMENSPSQSKVSPSMEVVDDEACMPQACPVSAGADTAKENIPSFHQNIHPNGAPSPLKENILASHHNIQAEVDMTPVKGASHPIVQAIEEMTPVTLLTQKLSSISIGPAANGEATPLTLLAQKLSSISLGDATDSVVP